MAISEAKDNLDDENQTVMHNETYTGFKIVGRAVLYQLRCYYMALLVLLTANNLPAQGGDTLRNAELSLEFGKINAAFLRLKHTAFNIDYRYSIGGDRVVAIDSATATYQVHNGMMSGTMGEVRLLRNGKYTISVNTEDSFIAIDKQHAETSNLYINVLDSFFRTANINGFEKIVLPGGGTKLSVVFKPDAFYKNYAVTYDDGYRITGVRIEYLNTELGDDGLPPPLGSTRIMEVRYHAYRNAAFDISIFDEGQYLRKNENGQWVGTGAYAGWEIMTATPDL
ncbi:MAG: hypothetical protein EAY75_00465 [Bacteroidetes bacterium]|nr:MAG: hypothetical protein EAY75_00465 [Bacteroidota bacterium]